MSPSYIHIQHCPPSLLSSINTNTLSLFYPHNELRIRLELLESSSHFLLPGNSSQLSTLYNCFAASHCTNHLISSLYPYPQPPTDCSRYSQSLPLSLDQLFCPWSFNHWCWPSRTWKSCRLSADTLRLSTRRKLSAQCRYASHDLSLDDVRRALTRRTSVIQCGLIHHGHRMFQKYLTWGCDRCIEMALPWDRHPPWFMVLSRQYVSGVAPIIRRWSRCYGKQS